VLSNVDALARRLQRRRRANSVKNAVLFTALIPRNVGVVLIRGYRAAISPLYGDVCRYYPSCSAYGLGSVQQRGLVIGSLLTAWRILRCNPWTAGGIDDVSAAKHSRYRVTRFGWVIPAGWANTAVPLDSGMADHDHEHSTSGVAGHEASVGPRAASAAVSPDGSRDDAELVLSSSTMSRKD
jgi:putative membrane protein insertion efficiency factor